MTLVFLQIFKHHSRKLIDVGQPIEGFLLGKPPRSPVADVVFHPHTFPWPDTHDSYL